MMRCETCKSEIVMYELFPRSYRLYIYLCRSCKKGFLAHHFDLNLEIYQMEEVEMKQSEKLVFITGLKVEPRVFDFEIDNNVESIIVADASKALGELALSNEYLFAPYSRKAQKRLKRILGLNSESDAEDLKNVIIKKWREAM